MDETWVMAAIGAATIAGSYAAARLQRPKIDAEAEESIGRTYRGLVEDLRTEMDRRIDKLETELEWERTRNYQLVAWSKALAAQVIEHGGTPVEYEEFRS